MKKRKRSLWLVLLLAAVLALSLLTGCRKAGAGEQDNSAALHSTVSEAQASQDTGKAGDEGQELILYDDDDFQDSVYAEEEDCAVYSHIWKAALQLYHQEGSTETGLVRGISGAVRAGKVHRRQLFRQLRRGPAGGKIQRM